MLVCLVNSLTTFSHREPDEDARACKERDAAFIGFHLNDQTLEFESELITPATPPKPQTGASI